MKEPNKIPINPDAPRTKQVKAYSLKSTQNEFLDIDSYIDNNQKLYKIHDDFYVQSSNYNNILKHYNIANYEE